MRTIKYVMRNENVRVQATPQAATWGMEFGLTNPNWDISKEDGSGMHSSSWIEYKTMDGSLWASKIETHSKAFSSDKWITFKHYRVGMDPNGEPDHEDDSLVVLDWHLHPCLIKAWFSNPDGSPPFVIEFSCTPIPVGARITTNIRSVNDLIVSGLEPAAVRPHA